MTHWRSPNKRKVFKYPTKKPTFMRITTFVGVLALVMGAAGWAIYIGIKLWEAFVRWLIP